MKHLVIIPTWNAEKHLERCILSLKKHGVSIFGIDNCSTDGTQDIFKKHDVWFFSQNDHGTSEAINSAVRLTHADVYSIIGADDEWIASPQLIVDFFSKNDNEWAYSPLNFADQFMMGTRLYTLEEMTKGNKIPGVSMFFKRDLLLREPWDEKIKYANDYEYTMRLMSKGIMPGFIDVCMVKYNLTGRNDGLSQKSIEEAENLKKKYADICSNNRL